VSPGPENLSEEELRRSGAVVLNDVAVSPSLGRRLKGYVEQGGGLFVRGRSARQLAG
jgi:hypothetical protein